MNDKLIKAHSLAFHNKEWLSTSSVCGCFCCLETFMPEEIEKWVDDGETALCPFCEIDSVIASEDVEFLKEMQDYWFES